MKSPTQALTPEQSSSNPVKPSPVEPDPVEPDPVEPSPVKQTLKPTWIWQRLLGPTCVALLLSSLASSSLQAQVITRYLEVRRVRGSVTLQGNSQAAQVGDRLQQGQGLSTGPRSSAGLVVEDGIARIRVAENTDFLITGLRVEQNGARITGLDVSRGQVQFNARRFTNPDSSLQINTPAGTAAVRGTEFGITVTDLSGRSAVAARSGAVDVSAQNQTVTVAKDQYSTVRPGEPPTPPQPLSPTIDLDVLLLVHEGNRVRLGAVTNPPNLVYVNQQSVEIDRDGRFEVAVSGPVGNSINILVRNPFGEERLFQVGVR